MTFRTPDKSVPGRAARPGDGRPRRSAIIYALARLCSRRDSKRIGASRAATDALFVDGGRPASRHRSGRRQTTQTSSSNCYRVLGASVLPRGCSLQRRRPSITCPLTRSRDFRHDAGKP